MNSGVYAIVNKVNGKIYIGSSCNLKSRICNHFSLLKTNKHKNSYLQNAFNKYGRDAFGIKIIKHCKRKYLLKYEQQYINQYQSCNPHCGYNLSLKACRIELTEESKEKIRQASLGNNYGHANLGRKHTPEELEKMSKANKGQKPSIKAIEKAKEFWADKNRSKEAREKMRLSKWGKSVSEETREKMRQNFIGKKIGLGNKSNSGRKLSEETKRKISEAKKGNKCHLGIKHTEETKKKMRENHKSRKEVK